jgi:hypothetical protein
MKRILLLLVPALALAMQFPLGGALGQDSGDRAAAIAAQQDFEERYRRLLSDIEDLKDGLAAQQKRLAEAIRDMERMHEETSRGNARYATRDDLNGLADKIREVDRKREEDQKLVLREIEKLGKVRIAAVEVPPESMKPLENGKGFEYRVKSGENFGVIVKKFNEKLKAEGAKGQITVDQLAKANPNVDPKKLKVGQKLFVPEPAQ